MAASDKRQSHCDLVFLSHNISVLYWCCSAVGYFIALFFYKEMVRF